MGELTRYDNISMELTYKHSFEGGDDFLCGGNCGIEGLTLESIDEVKYWLFDTSPPDSPATDDEDQAAPTRIIHIDQFGGYEVSQAFLVPHTTWRLYGDPMAENGEYRYVHSGDGEQLQWFSIRHYIADQVVQFEVVAVLRALNTPPTYRDPNNPLSLEECEAACQTDRYWSGIKETIKRATDSNRIADEAVEVFKKAWEKKRWIALGGGDAKLLSEDSLQPTPVPARLKMDQALYMNPTLWAYGTPTEEMEKAMQTEGLWNQIESWTSVKFENKRVEYKQGINDIIDMYKNAWGERSREKEGWEDEGK